MQKAKVNHPYIEADKKICGGSPVIKGTRMRVVDIAIEYEYLNHTPDEIINAHPHLKLEQIHDALSYYYENRKELDEKIKRDASLSAKIELKTESRGAPIRRTDAMIAAITINKGASLYTLDLKHFQPLKALGLKLFP